VQKNFELFCRKYLKNFDPMKDPDQKELAFPVPNVIFEIARTSTLIFPSWNIFIKPPETMEELQARRVYENTRTQAKQGNFTETIAALSQILPVFNKTGQKYAFYLVLLELGRLALKVGDYDQVQKKFDVAINFAEKNEGIVSQDEYIQIQEELADAHFKFKNYDNAVRQLTILYNYLERSRPASDTKLPDILIKLNKIFILRDDSESLDFEIQKYFKKIKDFADKQKDKVISAQYYHILGLYYKKRGKISSAISSFKKGIAGCSVMGNGDISLLLDTGGIIKEALV
jgi:tetratricopeptide (TPR) repeat protein